MCKSGGEESFCGSCCSPRSWLVTHVVFVCMLVFEICSLWYLELLRYPATTSLKHANEYDKQPYKYKYGVARYENYERYKKQREADAEIIADLRHTLEILIVVVTGLRVVWAILGWTLLYMRKRTASKQIYCAYILLGFVDLAFNLAFIIYPILQLDKLSEYDGMELRQSAESSYGNKKSPLMVTMTTIVVPAALTVLFDLGPLLCFVCCRSSVIQSDEPEEVYELDIVPHRRHDYPRAASRPRQHGGPHRRRHKRSRSHASSVTDWDVQTEITSVSHQPSTHSHRSAKSGHTNKSYKAGHRSRSVDGSASIKSVVTPQPRY